MSYEYLKPEDRTRHEIINPMLEEAGWVVQHFKTANVYVSKGVAVEFFPMGMGVEEADYVLFVDGKAAGIIEAKKEDEPLIGEEPQSNRHAKGFPRDFNYVDLPLPFVYESSESETRSTNLWGLKPRSRELFWFHRPETLGGWIKKSDETSRQWKITGRK